MKSYLIDEIFVFIDKFKKRHLSEISYSAIIVDTFDLIIFFLYFAHRCNKGKIKRSSTVRRGSKSRRVFIIDEEMVKLALAG